MTKSLLSEFLTKEDFLLTSPGTILHYFSCLNYLEGVRTLLRDPYNVYHSPVNKNGLSPLFIASVFNNIDVGTENKQYLVSREGKFSFSSSLHKMVQ